MCAFRWRWCEIRTNTAGLAMSAAAQSSGESGSSHTNPGRKVTLKNTGVLAGGAQWTERWPVNQRVTGSIPSQGMCLGCRLDLL